MYAKTPQMRTCKNRALTALVSVLQALGCFPSMMLTSLSSKSAILVFIESAGKSMMKVGYSMFILLESSVPPNGFKTFLSKMS